MQFDFTLEFILPAKPNQVLRLLTDAELIRAWSGAHGYAEPKVGGHFEMFDGWVKGKVYKASNTELAYTWKTTDWAEESKESEVHYILEPHTEGTKITLSHKGLPDWEEMESHKEGWSEHFFGPMEEYFLVTKNPI
jgi:uncharacterized protein YndB with AHSA1/START domain